MCGPQARRHPDCRTPRSRIERSGGRDLEKLVVDLEGHKIGDTITISEIKLPEGTKPTIDREFVIANIAAPRALASADDDEEEVAAEE